MPNWLMETIACATPVREEAMPLKRQGLSRVPQRKIVRNYARVFGIEQQRNVDGYSGLAGTDSPSACT